LADFDRRGDFSYGVYIYAFPVQQTLSLLGMNRYGLGAYFVLAMVLTLPFAIASWRLVEKPCLRLKRLTLSGAWLSWRYILPGESRSMKARMIGVRVGGEVKYRGEDGGASERSGGSNLPAGNHECNYPPEPVQRGKG
jgi:hypothetical protein